jgi:crossover junction endodeoxyribonuclease RuvC
MRVLGLDPSLTSTGYGIIEYDQNVWNAVQYGVIKSSPRLPFHQRINTIRLEIEDLIKKHRPEEIAIENPFYAHNVKTAMLLGQVRGAILVAIASHNCSLHEYSALEIKKAVTGYGQAEKDQVSFMVRTLLHIDDDNMPLDASDALATAVCHANSRIFQEKINRSQET